ncbi:MAG: hypothetical protein ACLQNE_40835 [Thermoguttaceae bacterium]|jgi:hypothetical protein
MAKKPRINKTQAVREYLQAHPHTPNKGVAEALTKQGISITANHVGTIKAKSRKRRSAVKAVVTKSGLGIPELKLAMGLLKACGSVAAAKEALVAADEIKAIWSS